jgi:cyclophilin family peptidyl-prolyl cis-trans isomerase
VNPLRASSGSQFYIVVNKSGQKSLDGAYTVFGEVIKGMEAADSISNVPKNGSDLPNQRIPMNFKILKKTKAEIESEFGFKVE